MLLGRRIGAIALVLFISGGDAAACAGWQATAEARMACCLSGACPMHQADEKGSRSTGHLSQAEADGCCAASEPADPASTSPVFAMTLPTEVVFAALNLRRDLPLHQPVTIAFTPDTRGESTFACGMNMLRGALVVE